MAGSVISSLKILIGADSGGVATAMSQTEATAKSWAGRITGLLGGISFAGLSIGALGAANKFQEASVQMQRSTGATEERLKMLEKVAASAYGKTTAALSDVANVTAILSTRTQATGKDLEDLTLKTIKLAKTQREDVGTIVPLVTRAFGDWSIATGKQSAAMDYFRTISQMTGTQVTKLADTVVYAGAPLRMLGYDFNSATALIGKFEKEGVNTEIVLGGMKAALQKFAKDGVTDTAKAWRDFVAGVKSGQITLSDTLQLVGAKRGADLYRAIVEGRFEIDQMTKSAQELASKGGESIETTAAKFKKLQHQIEAAISSHRDLIITIGLIGPTALTMGAAFVKFGIVALPIVANIVTALRLDMIGALNAVELRVMALAGTISIVTAVLAALIVQAKIASDINDKIPVDKNDRSKSTIDRFRAGYSGVMPTPAPVKAPTEDERWAALGKSLPKVDWGTAIATQTEEDAKKIKEAFSDLGLKDLRKQLEDSAKAFELLTSAGKLNSAQIKQTQAQISELRRELALMDMGIDPKRLNAAIEGLLKAGKASVQFRKDWDTTGVHFGVVAAEALKIGDEITASVRKLAEPTEETRDLMEQLGDTSLAAFRKMVDASPEAAVSKIDAAMQTMGVTATSVSQRLYKALVDLRTLVAAQVAAGLRPQQDIENLDRAIQDAYGKIDGTAKKSTQERSAMERTLSAEIIDLNRRTFTDLERGLAQSIINWKGWGESVKNVMKSLGTGVMEILMKTLFKPLEDKLSTFFGGLIGNKGSVGSKGATPDQGSFPGGGANPGGGGMGGSGGGSGAMGIAGLAVQVGQLVSSIVGNFQMSGMQQKLWHIEENTRGLLNVIFLNGPGTLVDCAIRSFQELVGIHATLKGGIPTSGGSALPAGASVGGVNFINCTFGADSMGTAVRQMRLAGANI